MNLQLRKSSKADKKVIRSLQKFILTCAPQRLAPRRFEVPKTVVSAFVDGEILQAGRVGSP